MNKRETIPEMGAEMLLNLLYPELADRWVAHHDGTFYRNYNRDVLDMDAGQPSVRLSRDSMLALLPQGVISREDELLSGDVNEKHKHLEQEKKILSEAFLPIDSLAFRRSLQIERQVSELLDDKLSYLLKTYFGFDLAAETNPYVRELAPLLPYIRHRRGDFGLVKNLLRSLFRCPVTQLERRYSELDSTLCWIPLLRYELLIPGLSAQAYMALSGELQPLTDFLAEWFVPAEVRLEIAVKQHGEPRQLDSQWTLDYNTEL